MLFLLFIREVWRDGVARTSGIGSVVFGLVGASLSKPLPTRSFWTVAFVCFAYACFRVWKNKHLDLVAANTRIGGMESVDHELERRRQRAELEKLEEENRRVAAQRAIEDLDNRVLALLKEDLDEMRKQNEIHSNIQAYSREWFLGAAKRLRVTEDAVRDSMLRLKAANRMPTLADLILTSPWPHL